MLLTSMNGNRFYILETPSRAHQKSWPSSPAQDEIRCLMSVKNPECEEISISENSNFHILSTDTVV